MSPNNLEMVNATMQQINNDLREMLKHALIELKRINNGTHPPLICEKPTFRFKQPQSILEKITRKNIDLANIRSTLKDLVGIRIICLDLKRLEILVDRIKSSGTLEIVDQKRWIEVADVDGYRGVHLIFALRDKGLLQSEGLKGEIQVRTIGQHFWASFSHRDLYKTNRILSESTNQRIKQLSNDLYSADLETQRLEAEIKEDPLNINIRTLSSLLVYLNFRLDKSEIGTLYSLLKVHNLDWIGIPNLQSALLTNLGIDSWIKRIFEVIIGKPPTLIDLLFFRIFTELRGNYWPKRRSLELVLASNKNIWVDTFKTDGPRDLLLLLETFFNGPTEKYFFTWSSLDKRQLIWSRLVDNRYTVKHLSELELIECASYKTLISKETPSGIYGKHAYTVTCSEKGNKTSEQCIGLFHVPNAIGEVIGELEIEDFPDDDTTNWGLPKSAGISITQYKEEGPCIIENDWWSGSPNYY